MLVCRWKKKKKKLFGDFLRQGGQGRAENVKARLRSPTSHVDRRWELMRIRAQALGVLYMLRPKCLSGMPLANAVARGARGRQTEHHHAAWWQERYDCSQPLETENCGAENSHNRRKIVFPWDQDIES